MRINLGAYQVAEIIQENYGMQGPHRIMLKLTTAMDEPFINRTVTALLSEQAQRDIIEALQHNLDGKQLLERR